MSLNSQLEDQTLLLDVCCLPEMLDDESTRVKYFLPTTPPSTNQGCRASIFLRWEDSNRCK